MTVCERPDHLFSSRGRGERCPSLPGNKRIALLVSNSRVQLKGNHRLSPLHKGWHTLIDPRDKMLAGGDLSCGSHRTDTLEYSTRPIGQSGHMIPARQDHADDRWNPYSRPIIASQQQMDRSWLYLATDTLYSN